jgi:RNA polymerase sigma-70 factor, ECF subfamily
MATADVSLTSTSLLCRVQQHDELAWERLAKLYTPLVYRWARQCGLQADDAADVIQEVFAAVAGHIESFRHDEADHTFRGWLWTITRNQVRLYFRRLERVALGQGGSDANHFLLQQPDLLDSDEEPAGFDSRRSLVHRAVELIRDDFQPQTWQAFWRQVVEGQPSTEVAADLAMTPAAVRQAKYRVLCRLQEELDSC